MLERSSYAKINIFLKITGKSGGYHNLFSRFVLVNSLADTLIWQEGERFSVTFESSFLNKDDLATLHAENSLLKAKRLLESYVTPQQKEVLEHTHIQIFKNIPLGSGLGGGSSNAGIFLQMAREILGLSLTQAQWIELAKGVGADVPFFVDQIPSANIQGIGEEIAPFAEEELHFEIFTPPLACSTADVYRHYSQHVLACNPFAQDLLSIWSQTPSKILLAQNSLKTLNDLSISAFALYPSLKEYVQDGWFLSGSGSSFFRLIGG